MEQRENSEGRGELRVSICSLTGLRAAQPWRSSPAGRAKSGGVSGTISVTGSSERS